MDTARDIRSVANGFGVKLALEPELAAWARKEKERYTNLLKPDDFSANTDDWIPRIKRERPALAQALTTWKHQLPGVAFLVGQKATLLADQPGLGKTIQTLATVAELDVRGPILVVAPRTAVNVTWPEEIAQWLGDDEVIVKITGTMKPGERKDALTRIHKFAVDNPEVRVWVLCGPNYLRIRADLDGQGNYARDAQGKKIIRAVNEGLAELFNITWSAVIVDESHQTLAGATGNKKKQSAQRRGLGELDIRPGGLKIAISGTPFRGKTENLWGTLNWLYPEKYTSYWNWVRRHYGIVNTGSRYGSGISKGDKIIDENRFFGELRPIMVRRTKREVAKDLPPKMYGGNHLLLATGVKSLSDVPVHLWADDRADERHDWMLRNFGPVSVWLPLSSKQMAQYNEIVGQALITIDAMGDTINVNGVLAEMVRMKQVANAGLGVDIRYSGGIGPVMPSNKVEWIIDFLVDRIEAGTKTIIASQFTQFIEFLSIELNDKGINHYKLTGKTKDDERAWIRREFQKDEGEMVILLNTKAGGVSLTLDSADDVVVVDQTWIPDDQEQVEDRAHRLSRMHNVTIWNLASLGTIDEDVATTNAERESAIMGILDKQRGVNYVKQLIAKTKQRQGVTV
jgi:SNF2 family DNA or RNA helicase